MRTTHSRRVIAAIVALGVFGLAAACGDDGSSGGSADGSVKGTKVGMIGMYNAPYMTNAAAGAEAAADEVGAEFHYYGPQGLDPDKAIADFQNAVATGNKGLITFAYPSELWRNPIDRAVDQGVTVSTADIYSDGSKAITHTGPPKLAMGAALAQAFADQLPEGASGQIVPGICVPGVKVTLAPLPGFVDRMKELRPDVEVVDPEATVGDPAQNFAAWQRIVAKYPNALGFFGMCDVDLPNLAKLKEDNPAAKWLVGATVGGDDAVLLDALKTGDVVGAISQRSWVQGYVGMKLILNHMANGDDMPNGWINTGFDLVTKDNVDQIKKVVSDPAAAKAYYGAMAEKIVEGAASDAHTPLSYEYDPASINEPNPQP